MSPFFHTFRAREGRAPAESCPACVPDAFLVARARRTLGREASFAKQSSSSLTSGALSRAGARAAHATVVRRPVEFLLCTTRARAQKGMRAAIGGQHLCSCCCCRSLAAVWLTRELARAATLHLAFLADQQRQQHQRRHQRRQRRVASFSSRGQLKLRSVGENHTRSPRRRKSKEEEEEHGSFNEPSFGAASSGSFLVVFSALAALSRRCHAPNLAAALAAAAADANAGRLERNRHTRRPPSAV